MADIFNGRQFATRKLEKVQQQVTVVEQVLARPLTVVSIYPHEDPASVLYTNLKKKDARGVGIAYQTVPLALDVGRHTWLRAVMSANRDVDVQAILVQKPSRGLYEKVLVAKDRLDFSTWWQNIAEAIDPNKDIDGLAPMTLFRLEKAAERVSAGGSAGGDEPLVSLDEYLLPATAQAVIDIALEILKGEGAETLDGKVLHGKRVAVIGRSVIVGRPAAAGFTLLGAEVKLLSSQSDLSRELADCDIVVSATGKANLVAGKWVKPGSILIDVGAPVPEFDLACYERASWYTPVPYGVGPVTRACLLENLFKLPEIKAILPR
jgi:methylenetetrahydrofolate dehydrogenase (NADP+)/methenyltetrahydrofolate cyclohydrolase